MSSSPRSATLKSLACVISKTHNLQAFFFFVFSTQTTVSVLTETMETGNKYCCVIEAMHVLGRKLRYTTFPDWVCP